MEWEQFEYDESLLEEEENMIVDEQITEYVQWDDNYNQYLNNLEDHENFSQLHFLVENYNGSNNINFWTKWEQVPKIYHLQIYKLLIYQIEMRLCPSLQELRNNNAFSNYLLFLANALYGD